MLSKNNSSGKKNSSVSPSTAGKVAGYVRKSHIQFPDDCTSPEARAAYVHEQKTMRVNELIADAARDNLTIDLWYDDMGVSGRGEFLEQRTGFECLRRDAKDGKVGILYARDLSRLFRDLVQQELWFSEMEAAGCAVRIQDLPYMADAATRTLIRQQLGSINQYFATRQGEVIRATMQERVKAGLWVGRTSSYWCLKYNPETHGYDYDPATAENARRLFSLWIALGGNSGATCRALNRALESGEEDALPPLNFDKPYKGRPKMGGRWCTSSVQFLIRLPLYRRQTEYLGARYPMPHLIPEVVAPEVLAEADRLDALRCPSRRAGDYSAQDSPFQDPSFLVDRRAGGRRDNTYSGLLVCGFCGAPLGALRPRPSTYHNPHAPGPLGKMDRAEGRWLSWFCTLRASGGNQRSAVSESGHVVPRVCHDAFAVQQYRIDRLIGAAIAEALQEALEAASEAGQGSGKTDSGKRASDKKSNGKDAYASALTTLDARQARVYDLWEKGLLTDVNVLQERLARIADERRRLETLMQRGGTEDNAGALPVTLSPEQLAVLQAHFGAAFFHPPDLENPDALDREKQAFLNALGIRASVTAIPRPSPSPWRKYHDKKRKEPDAQEHPRKARRQGGPATVVVEIAALGRVGVRAITKGETEEEFAEVCRRRTWGIRAGREAMMAAGTWFADWDAHHTREKKRKKKEQKEEDA